MTEYQQYSALQTTTFVVLICHVSMTFLNNNFKHYYQ